MVSRGSISWLALTLLALVAMPLAAATVTGIVPSIAPHGARLLVTGSGLDAGPLSIAFTAATGNASQAVIVSRTSNFAEVIVPPAAVSGPVTVASVSSLTFPFTLASDPEFMKVATLAASDKAHDVFKSPAGVAVALPTGMLFVADTAHHRVAVLQPNGTLAFVAGNGHPGLADGTATTAQFKAPQGIAVDNVRQVVYIADTGNSVIRRMTFDGVVTTFAGSGHEGIADGSGAQAMFKAPAGLAVDPNGNVYVADTGNSAIRMITSAGAVSTIAGGMHEGFADGPIAQALFKEPQGITVSASGALYVADTMNHAIRKIENGTVSTVAGTGYPGFTDGAALTATFKQPTGVSVDDAGNLFIADSMNHAIREIAAGAVTTLTGNGTPGNVDGAPATAQFNLPTGIAADGPLFLADAHNDALRVVYQALHATAIFPRRGPLAGGNTIRLFGTGFVPGATQVTIGGTVATVTFVSSTELLVAMPADSAGTVDITVTTPAGSDTLANAYTYLPPPAISSIDPHKGPIAGGRNVTISGTNFVDGGDTTVTIGGVAVASTFNSSSSLTATTPAKPAGPADVTVTTPGGATTSGGGFIYFAPPVLSAFAPAQGSTGTSITILGQDFDSDPNGDTVLFAGVASPVTFASPTKLVANVPTGATSGRITVTTAGGSVTSAADFVVANYVRLSIVAPSSPLKIGDTAQLTLLGVRADGSTTDVTALATWDSSTPSVATISPTGALSAVAAGTTTIVANYASLSTSDALTVVIPEPVPPDPSTLAPKLDPTVVPMFADEISFLYTGPNAIQTGVAANAIAEHRATVIRGRVITPNGQPLAAVHVTALNHPEVGQTLSRADGMFDFVINGGGTTVLQFAKTNYITAQRSVTTTWNQQTTIDDVTLIAYDAQVTAVAMGAPSAQVARGSSVNDSDGTRQATLIVPASVTANLVMPDGSRPPVPVLHVRATEFTVGANGPKAMPAPLPPASAYTYCVELSADEALAAGATQVQFSKPLALYVENFIGFPVGTVIPSGYYDRQRGAWAASDNGVVVKIVSITNGAADIDLNGDGVAETAAALAAIGIDVAERQMLATLYSAGATLWRTPVSHFTPWDENWPYAPPPDAIGPGQSPAYWHSLPSPADRNGEACGASFVNCYTRTLGESIPIQGTPFTLDYDSSRVARTQYKISIPLSGATVPASLKSIDLTIGIAGRSVVLAFPPQPNLTYDFTWDGTDAYGRPAQGARTAVVSIGYKYGVSYTKPDQFALAWARSSNTPINGLRGRSDVDLLETYTIDLGHYDMETIGFGGWSFSAQHLYDSRGAVIYDGAEPRVSDPNQTHQVALSTYAGTTQWGYSGDGGSALAAKLDGPQFIAVAPDDTLYIADSYLSGYFTRIRRVDPVTHIITTIAGNGTVGLSADGSLAATSAVSCDGVATGPDGTLYFIDGGTRIRAIVGGILTTVAGNGQLPGYASTLPTNGSIATQVPIIASSIAVGSDNALFIGTYDGAFRVGPDGITAQLMQSTGYFVAIAAASDGTVYTTDTYAVYKISRSGDVSVVAGTPSGNYLGDLMDGQPATSGALAYPYALAVAPDGTLLISETSIAPRIRAVGPDGVATTLVGTGHFPQYQLPADGLLARSAGIGPWGIAAGPDGSVYVDDQDLSLIRKTGPLFPRAGRTGIALAAPDGATADIFTAGRHTATVDTLTGTTLLTFGYDTNGFLTSVTDADNDLTTIQRDPTGTPTAIVAPGGQVTSLSVVGGKLTAVSNPAGSYQMDYNTAGLMAQLTDPRKGLHKFTFDDDGLVTRDDGPDGSYFTLSDTGVGQNRTVTRTTAEGRVHTLVSAVAADTTTERQHVLPDGSATTQFIFGATATETTSDGLRTSATSLPDPRFGMQASYTGASTIIAGSQKMTITSTRTAAPDPVIPIAAASAMDKLTINGHTWTSSYDGSTRSLTLLTPMGRTSTSTLDAKGRPVSSLVPGITATTMAYNGLGQLTTIQQGNRTLALGYDEQRRLASVTDPIQRTVRFTYDTADRVVAQTLPDGRVIGFTYDANGNVTSVTPPSRPAHQFAFTPGDLVSDYTPPSVPSGGATHYSYNLDRQLTIITRPDGSTVNLTYDPSGRLSILGIARGNYTFGYNATTRQLTSVTAPDGSSLTYGYSGPLLTSITSAGTVAGSIAFAYDNDFRVVQSTVGGSGVSFGYDTDGLLTSAGALGLQRDANNGLLLGTTLGSVSDSWSYDALGEVAAYSAAASGSSLFSEQVTRNDVGQIVQKTETIGSETHTYGYGYDSAGRLTSASKDAMAATYAYDDNGNRTSDGVHAATYDAQDRLVSYGDATYSYTPNGELATKSDAYGTTRYAYDELGNLLQVQLWNGNTVNYTVDAANHRVARDGGTIGTKHWLWEGELRIGAELDGSGNLISRFVYATHTNVPDFMVRAGTTYRIITDHLGSVRLVVDATSGAIAQRMDYDEFGRVLVDTNPGFQPFGFAGGLYDPDTQLVRLGARDYDPAVGRWTAKDPIRFAAGSPVLYEYAGNDPVNGVDPTGLDDVTSDPHVQEMILNLWRQANEGGDPYEHFAFLTRHDTPAGFVGWYFATNATYHCFSLKMTYERNQYTIPAGTQIPPETIAVIHTHPRARTTEPDDPLDRAAANAFNADDSSINALYTLTYRGVGKFVPGATHGTQEQTSLHFPNAAKDGCGCH